MINPKKYIVLLNPGEKPTIPSPKNIRPSSIYWKKTDILIGAWAYNVFDKKWYTRDSLGIKEIQDPRFVNVDIDIVTVYNYIDTIANSLAPKTHSHSWDDIDVLSELSLDQVDIALYNNTALKWRIKLNLSNNNIEFYNAAGVKKAWVDQNGNLSAVGEVAAYVS